jgi:hypothetical protein
VGAPFHSSEKKKKKKKRSCNAAETPRSKTFKLRSYAEKVTPYVLWAEEGSINIEVMPEGT